MLYLDCDSTDTNFGSSRVMVVCPLVLTSYLNVLVFLLPPNYGDKASYIISVTISVSVFASFFNGDMPRGR